MFTSRLGRLATFIVTGMFAGTAAAGCSKDAERSPTLETASSADSASADSARVAPDTASTVGDSSAAMPPGETTAAAVKPVRRASLKPASRPARPPRQTGQQPGPDTAAQAAAPDPDKWLSYDAASNTVTFELIAGPFTFNGYSNGGATLVVPSRATVVMNFVNKDGTPHSAIIITGDGPIPNSASDPAIPRAYTNKVLEGLPQEAGDVMRFTVPESGTYRIFCGVPGHGLSGMWIWMRVDPAAKTPSFGPTKA